ncbi:MAG: TonB-dependent receptor [Bacteroidota bacterium]|jgi:hypothetical protein
MKLNKLISILLLFVFSLITQASYSQIENSSSEEEIFKEDDLDILNDLLLKYQIAGAQSARNIRSALNTYLSLQFFEANLKDIIKEISRSKKINFIFDDELLNIENVNFYCDERPLYEVLNGLLSPHNISFYEFEYAQITLAKQIKIDERTGGIRGKIKDNTGEILIGANVLIKDLGIGCMSDNKGNYQLRNIKPGEYTLEVSYIGYEKVSRKIKITSGQILEINFVLNSTSFLIGGIEVIGASDLLPSDVTTKTTITSGEIEHFQASSIKDVLDLVPGVQKTDNPGLGKTTQVALRGDEGDNLSAFGTLVIIDGTPVSNNANLQFERASGATFGTSNLKGSVDLRTIPADNIQNLSVITGLPSVRYGDVTSGVINIKTKIGASPNRFKFKNNPNTREGNFEGGIVLGDGSLSYNLNAAQSERDVRITGDEYLRLTGQLVYSTSLFNNSLSTNNKISYQRILDEEEPKGDLRKTRNYNRGYTISLSSWGIYKTDVGISNLDYNLFATMRRENSMKSRLQTDYVILPSGDTIASYIGTIDTRGIEWTFGGRLEWNSVFYTGDIVHKVLAGIEPQYNANTGDGVMFDTLLNPYGQGSGKRPYSFDDIPGQLLLGIYFEDRITAHFIFDFNLIVGFRYEMYRPNKFNLSGLWGDGNIIESRQGTYFNPRLNLMIYLSKVNQLRLSAGTSSKSPPMSMIYPVEDVFPWRNPDDNKNYYLRYNLHQPDLKGYRETLYEISYDHKFFDKIGITSTAYYKIRKGNPVSYPIPVFQTSTTANKTKVYFVDEYSLYNNIGRTDTKGLEFTLRTSKIDPLNMDLMVTGSYSFIKNPGVGYNYSATPDASKGQRPNYKVPNVPVDTLIGWIYPRGEKWNDRLQINYSLKYTVPALGLWITLRAEQLVFERSQTFDHAPIDRNVTTPANILNFDFYREIKLKPNKWLFSFNMSKSLFAGAEVSFYVNNLMDDPAIRRYYSSPTVESDEQRNPSLFYGIEFSMIIDKFFN